MPNVWSRLVEDTYYKETPRKSEAVIHVPKAEGMDTSQIAKSINDGNAEDVSYGELLDAGKKIRRTRNGMRYDYVFADRSSELTFSEINYQKKYDPKGMPEHLKAQRILLPDGSEFYFLVDKISGQMLFNEGSYFFRTAAEVNRG